MSFRAATAHNVTAISLVDVTAATTE